MSNHFLDVNLFYIRELESYTLNQCPILHSSAWIRILIFVHFLPLFLTTGYYIVSPLRKELYIVFVGMGMLLDSFLNMFLTNLIKNPIPYAGCGPQIYNLPDTAVQQFSFTYCLILSYHSIQGIEIGWYERVVMTMMMTILPVAQIRLGYASLLQVLFGVLIGTLEAILWQLFAAKILANHMHKFAQWKLIKFLGYKETMWKRE